MDQAIQDVVSFWIGFACGVAAYKFGWPRLKAKIDEARSKIREKL
mgnify:FL=1